MSELEKQKTQKLSNSTQKSKKITHKNKNLIKKSQYYGFYDDIKDFSQKRIDW